MAAQQALTNVAIPPEAHERAAVCLGTGLGELGETAAFLENLIRLDEREPRPTCFTNSVHNSLASQVAIQLKFGGENHTVTHGPVSFELALWQALVLLKTGRAGYVLALGVDELNPYAAYAGADLGLWRLTGGPQPPGTFPGEGAAAFLLGGPILGRGAPYIKGVKARPLDARDLSRVSPAAEVDFLQQTVTAAGLNLGDLDLILTGADSEAQLQDLYLPTLTALGRAAGREIGYGLYKNLCGEFCSASAIGLGLAVEILQGNRIPPGFVVRGGREPAGLNNILLYQIARPGFHSACLVGR
jgi:3-oxoacyl-(acyl-carrier-protein) synthase